jgi:F0F1-type ATP synthase assembly protein I
MAKKPWPVLVGEYTSLAFLLPVCTAVGYVIGYLLDREFGTTWMRFAGVVLGTASGMVQLVRQLMRDSRDTDTQNSKDE